ncbi:MAG: hypothetical protein JXR76_10800 [Deltaproteobacteria bacterium]|nr:hypothetical protein [Deltaproteobacteria bacterium]
MKKNVTKTVGITFALLILVGALHTVLAANAENMFAGKIVVLDAIPPSWFNTKNGFVNFLKKHRTDVIHANEDNEWNFKAMAFFRKPLGDYEVEMVFYDVGDGTGNAMREFRGSVTQYTQDRNAKSLLGRTVLTRPTFDANRKYFVEVQSHGKTVATGTFSTKGISQSQLDQEKRIEHQQKEMQKSMEELKRKAEEQERKEQEQKKKDAAAGDDLF